MNRTYTAAKNAIRCRADVTLRDGSKAQCMRPVAWNENAYCWQHERQRIKRESTEEFKAALRTAVQPQ